VIVDLDHEASLDPARVGAKAAWLAMGRRVGLPILPGIVVEGAASLGHIHLGAEKLAGRGSGGARLAITAEPFRYADELVARASRLGDRLVVRSSTALEGSGEFSGAFTSYLDVGPEDLPRAVTGCWASAFSVAALQRQEAAGIEPGSFPMAVLVQRALDPSAGGTATVDDDGTVLVTGVKGSPVPLLQGWSSGHEARISSSGDRVGAELEDLVGADALESLASAMRRAKDALGVNQCEWAQDGEIWLVQMMETHSATSAPAPQLPIGTVGPALVSIARTVARARGRLGEDLVLPWALGGLPASVRSTAPGVTGDAMTLATELRDELVAEVWSLPAEKALLAARACMAGLLGPDPEAALDQVRRLHPPDPGRSALLLALVDDLQARDDHLTDRHGVGRWEPFLAAVVLSAGTHHQGSVASTGFGAGIRCHIGLPDDTASFSPRSVITAPQPIQNLAPLLWDAAGIVTATGSRAAHLFESARALGIPAVCGVDLPSGQQILAIDGSTGVVASLPLHGGDDE
jgi:hypothetical protein